MRQGSCGLWRLAACVSSAAQANSLRWRFYRFFQQVWLDGAMAARVVAGLHQPGFWQDGDAAQARVAVPVLPENTVRLWQIMPSLWPSWKPRPVSASIWVNLTDGLASAVARAAALASVAPASAARSARETRRPRSLAAILGLTRGPVAASARQPCGEGARSSAGRASDF